ncbi:MAG TPA: phosphoribosylformylglycinamidine synthase subunit PurQ [Thermoanaerobaculia bacterium]|nr:phosphoribosylformylglycinamidine synthase subunit PurQ [Thermoanaerobaculia bacterium]
MRCGVVVFPGSNCDHDVYHVLKHVLDQEVTFLWHQASDLRGCDLVVLPGGFSYGDYLRAGALAALSPVMAAVKRHAERGGQVVGICNGFQILLEAGLLPGAMRRNRDLRFLCRDVHLRVERTDLPFTHHFAPGQVVRMPVAHAEGNYEDSAEALDRLEANGQVVFRYADPDGTLAPEANWNGSARAIAGICSEGGNVLGLMPHPERCSEEVLGNAEGLALFAGAVGARRAQEGGR